jgi:hypothetical protein
MKIINHGIIEVPPGTIANADAVRFENYKTNTPGKFQIRQMDESDRVFMMGLANKLNLEYSKLDYVYFSVCKGAEPHTDLLDPAIFEPRTFVIPVVLPQGKSVITAQDESAEVKLNHIYEFNHEEVHSMELEDIESGCVVIMVAVKR